MQTGDTAGMEGTHGQLSTGLTDGLCGDNTDRLAQTDRLAVGHIGNVAACADAGLCRHCREMCIRDSLPDGTVDLADRKQRLRPDTVLVAVTAVDSELGVVQPIACLLYTSRCV